MALTARIKSVKFRQTTIRCHLTTVDLFCACTSDTADRASEMNPRRLNEIHEFCMADPRQLRRMHYAGLDLQLLTTHIQIF
jgi:hypothetical protein